MGAEPFALIAGGGTGGHIYPAIAIADALVARGHDRAKIQFVGSASGMEGRLVPDAGYSVILLPGKGITRKFGVESLKATVGLIHALLRAVVLVRRLRPSVVVSVGGYAAAPCAMAAVLWRVPLVQCEANAVPGAVNRLLGRFAAVNAVALPNTRLPRAEVTGNCVRPEIANLDRSSVPSQAARGALGLPLVGFCVAAFGGSLGSKRINAATVELAELWKERTDVAIHHVIGRRDWNLPGRRPSSGNYDAVEYQNQMGLLYAAADVVVCRSGSTTVGELSAAGVPSVLVPLPGAPGDHQTANARALQAVGAAVLVPDGQCDGTKLDAVLSELVDNPERLDSMSGAAQGLAIPDAASKVAGLVEKVARG